jgi:hypothetical protein
MMEVVYALTKNVTSVEPGRLRKNCHRVTTDSRAAHLFKLYKQVEHTDTDKSNPKHCPYVNQLMKAEPEHMFPINLYK